MLDRRKFSRSSKYIFAASNGTRIGGRNLLRWIKVNTRYTIHDLRHTYITRAAQAGVKPKVLQTLTGHARIETLLGIYAYVLEVDKREAAIRIANGK